MKGLSINPLANSLPMNAPKPKIAKPPAGAWVAAKLPKFSQRVKARLLQALQTFHHRLSYEEEVLRQRNLVQPFAFEQIEIKALLLNPTSGKVLRLNDKPRTLQILPDGRATFASNQVPSWQIAADPNALRLELTSNGLQVQSAAGGTPIQTFVSNDFVTLGKERFLLKILGIKQGAHYVE